MRLAITLGSLHPSTRPALVRESTIPHIYIYARDSTESLSHPLNVLVGQFASRSTVYIIAQVVFYVNNVIA